MFISSCLLLTILLSACALLGRDDEEEPANTNTAVTTLGNATRLEGNVTLVCSAECSNRGFCGEATGGEQVVLMNTLNPSTEAFDWIMLDQVPVTINNFQTRTVTYLLNNTTEAVNFYQVRNEAFEQAWVAGWCVGQ